jgi:hypothetical protein
MMRPKRPKRRKDSLLTQLVAQKVADHRPPSLWRDKSRVKIWLTGSRADIVSAH